jgi:hypothetical protein
MSGPTPIDVSTEAELNQAIATVDAATTGSYDIVFTANITEGTDTGTSITYGTQTLSAPPDLYALNLTSSVSVTIDGGSYALDGDNLYQGLFVFQGDVTIQSLTIENAIATGGAGAPGRTGGGGGGGAGLGGGLFVAGTTAGGGSGGQVVLSGVTFSNDGAVGGAGGGQGGASGGAGGGGLDGGNGGAASSTGGGGGGGIGAAGGAGNGSGGSPGGVGIVLGASSGGAGGGTPGNSGGSGGSNGGGGGGGGNGGGAGGGIGGQPGNYAGGNPPVRGQGGAGGYGGGGGGAIGNNGSTGGEGGFGAGGGGGSGNHSEVHADGGSGGFGGGGAGAGSDGAGGVGGFGAGHGGLGKYGPSGTTGGGGAQNGAGGGGGLGAGGDIFVQQGGSLTIEGGNLGAGSVSGGTAGAGTGGASGTGGQGFGGGIFLQGSETQTLEAIGTGTLTISGSIADENGSITTGYTSDTAGLMIAGSGTVKLDAHNTFTGGTAVETGATLLLGTAGAAGSGAISGAGRVAIGTTGTVTLGPTTGPDTYTGGTTIESGTLLLGTAGAAGSGDIAFGTGDPPVLAFALADAPTNTIDAFGAGDAIDITDLNATDITSFSFDTGGNVLTIDYTTGGGGASLDLNFTNGAGGDNFQYKTDGADGTLIVCYYPGTAIRTASGDVAVECLRIGDSVMLADGGMLPVRWIGQNTVSTRFADPLRVLPIRIRAGALAEGLPERDLLVSPEHAILVEDILVQAGALVNGVSIIRETSVPETFTYYHVELAEHALLLAEGLPAESFVDNVHRTAFDNWAEHVELYGDAPVTEMSYPRAQSRRQVPTEIHAWLLTRAKDCCSPAAGIAA